MLNMVILLESTVTWRGSHLILDWQLFEDCYPKINI